MHIVEFNRNGEVVNQCSFSTKEYEEKIFKQLKFEMERNNGNNDMMVKDKDKDKISTE